MLNTVKEVAKNGAIMFVVGALLALAAPALADMAGLAPGAIGHSADPLWMGSFFGAFGAIHAAVTPIFTGLFESKKPAEGKAVDMESARAPVLALATELPAPATSVAYSTRIEKERCKPCMQDMRLS